jgi:hypothetical protein
MPRHPAYRATTRVVKAGLTKRVGDQAKSVILRKFATTHQSGIGPDDDLVQRLPTRQLLGVKRTRYARRELFRV